MTMTLKKRVRINLSKHNMFYAGLVGVSRHVARIGQSGAYGISNAERGWQANCMGACGEIVVAKWLNRFYDGSLDDLTVADVGTLQVRTTAFDNGDLILHERDGDNDIFILVLAHEVPYFYLAGWCYAREGKEYVYWGDKLRNKRPAFWYPQHKLRDMRELEKQLSPKEV